MLCKLYLSSIKKAEHWQINAFELWCWRRFLIIPWMARRSNQSILKEISPEYSLKELMLKLRLFATPWTIAHQTPLSFTISRSLLKLMSIESVLLSNHLILGWSFLFSPLIFPSIRVFSNESVICIKWQSIGVSALALVLPMNIQGWFPLGLTGLISLPSKGLLRTFSRTAVRKRQFSGTRA